jgi:cytochrome c553
VRPATVAAGLLVCAAAAMAVAALASDGGEEEAPAPAATVNATATAEPAIARDGKVVWAQQGCGSCHTFAPADARGQFAPNLSSTLKGVPDSYIEESIVAPNKVAAAGYATGAMPEDYGARMSPAELDALVAFISSGVRD